MAKQHRKIPGSPNHNIIPRDSVYLSNPDGIITNNEKHLLETSSLTYAIEQYYMDRWSCTISHLTTLDWTTYHAQFQKARPTVRIYMIKMLTGWLPVHYHINKMSSGNTKCHLCQQPETIAHLFQCAHRSKWQRQLYVHLEQYLRKIHMPQPVCKIIMTHVKSIIRKSEEYSHFKHFTMFAGLLPRTWKELFAANNNNTNQQRDKWMKQLSQWLLTNSHDLWLARNNSLHYKEKKTSTMDYILNNKIAYIHYKMKLDTMTANYSQFRWKKDLILLIIKK